MQRGAAFVFTVSMIDMQKPWASCLLISDNESPVQSYTSIFEHFALSVLYHSRIKYLFTVDKWMACLDVDT